MLSMLRNNWLFNFGDDVLNKCINNYSSVKPEDIMKLIHYALWIEHLPKQVAYCKTTCLAYHVYPKIFNRPVVGKTALLCQKSE